MPRHFDSMFFYTDFSYICTSYFDICKTLWRRCYWYNIKKTEVAIFGVFHVFYLPMSHKIIWLLLLNQYVIQHFILLGATSMTIPSVIIMQLFDFVGCGKRNSTWSLYSTM